MAEGFNDFPRNNMEQRSNRKHVDGRVCTLRSFPSSCPAPYMRKFCLWSGECNQVSFSEGGCRHKSHVSWYAGSQKTFTGSGFQQPRLIMLKATPCQIFQYCKETPSYSRRRLVRFQSAQTWTHKAVPSIAFQHIPSWFLRTT